MNEQLLKVLVHIATESYDGHFTIMKFTTNWRVGFGTPEGREAIQELSNGKTFEEAAIKSIEREACKEVRNNNAKLAD